MRIRRRFRSASTFVNQLAAATVKALVISVVIGVFVVSLMHYMGVPVPSAHDLLGGLTRLARVGS